MSFLALVALVAAQTTDLTGFQTLVADPPPPALTRDSHYWIGNEDRLDLFYDEVKGKGGVHVGVGAEQNWLLCGWSRCDVLVLMDFDEAISDLHRVYIAAFATAATKEEFVALWTDKKRTGLRAAVKARFSGAQQKGALAALDVARWNVERRFAALRTQLIDPPAGRGLPTYFSDDADYAHLRQLVVAGKVFTVRGDLTKDKAMLGIAQAVTKAGLVVRSLYLSNAEQYFNYDRQTRANFAALPVDDATVVLRTHGWNTLRYAKGGNSYHYGIQTGPSLKAFLAERAVTSSKTILLWAPEHQEKGVSMQTSTAPLEAKAAWEASKKATTTGAKKKASAAPATPTTTVTTP